MNAASPREQPNLNQRAEEGLHRRDLDFHPINAIRQVSCCATAPQQYGSDALGGEQRPFSNQLDARRKPPDVRRTSATATASAAGGGGDIRLAFGVAADLARILEQGFDARGGIDGRLLNSGDNAFPHRAIRV